MSFPQAYGMFSAATDGSQLKQKGLVWASNTATCYRSLLADEAQAAKFLELSSPLFPLSSLIKKKEGKVAEYEEFAYQGLTEAFGRIAF
jgi:hypothetical protein